MEQPVCKTKFYKKKHVTLINKLKMSPTFVNISCYLLYLNVAGPNEAKRERVWEAVMEKVAYRVALTFKTCRRG